MNSPLGKYSQQVAAFIAVVVIVAAIVLHAFGKADSFVDNIALIAVGAVFGAAASTAVNGKAIEAAHHRLDTISAPTASATMDASIAAVTEAAVTDKAS